jgi:hypothetical protein
MSGFRNYCGVYKLVFGGLMLDARRDAGGMYVNDFVMLGETTNMCSSRERSFPPASFFSLSLSLSPLLLMILALTRAAPL